MVEAQIRVVVVVDPIADIAVASVVDSNHSGFDQEVLEVQKKLVEYQSTEVAKAEGQIGFAVGCLAPRLDEEVVGATRPR